MGKNDKGREKYKCNYCTNPEKIYSGSATTTIKDHLTKVHKIYFETGGSSKRSIDAIIETNESSSSERLSVQSSLTGIKISTKTEKELDFLVTSFLAKDHNGFSKEKDGNLSLLLKGFDNRYNFKSPNTYKRRLVEMYIYYIFTFIVDILPSMSFYNAITYDG